MVLKEPRLDPPGHRGASSPLQDSLELQESVPLLALGADSWEEEMEASRVEGLVGFPKNGWGVRGSRQENPERSLELRAVAGAHLGTLLGVGVQGGSSLWSLEKACLVNSDVTSLPPALLCPEVPPNFPTEV